MFHTSFRINSKNKNGRRQQKSNNKCKAWLSHFHLHVFEFVCCDFFKEIKKVINQSIDSVTFQSYFMLEFSKKISHLEFFFYFVLSVLFCFIFALRLIELLFINFKNGNVCVCAALIALITQRFVNFEKNYLLHNLKWMKVTIGNTWKN